MSKATKRKIKECLAAIGEVAFPSDDTEADLDAEWRAIKKAYFKKALATHPDKGGDAAAFREVNASFEVLRGLYSSKKVTTFRSDSVQSEDATNYAAAFADLGDLPTPSWEYYAHAAEEDVPPYRVEPAKSGRSKCVKTGELIAMGELRIGSLDQQSGGYGRWCRVDAWRVPGRVWLGLPDKDAPTKDAKAFETALKKMESVLLSGVSELKDDQLAALVAHVMDPSHYARLQKGTKEKAAKDAAKMNNQAAQAIELQEGQPNDATTTNAISVASQKPAFQAPVPGQDGAVANALAGKTVVLTGIFPELGGGAGLTLGKDRTTALVEEFGGRVTSAVSGKTNILLVGKEPGFSKVTKARERPGQITLLSLTELCDVLRGRALDDVGPLKIESFSQGYAVGGKPNSLALTASKEALAFAQGVAQPRLDETAAADAIKKPAPKRKQDAIEEDDDEDEDDEDYNEEEPAPKAPKPSKAKAKKPAAAPTKKKQKKTTAKKPEVASPPKEETAIVVKSRSGRSTRAPKKYTA